MLPLGSTHYSYGCLDIISFYGVRRCVLNALHTEQQAETSQWHCSVIAGEYRDDKQTASDPIDTRVWKSSEHPCQAGEKSGCQMKSHAFIIVETLRCICWACGAVGVWHSEKDNKTNTGETCQWGHISFYAGDTCGAWKGCVAVWVDVTHWWMWYGYRGHERHNLMALGLMTLSQGGCLG